MPGPVRGRVLAFAFLLAVVTYLDRICISAATPYIMDDLHLSVLQMSVVFSAFTLAYSLFEIPSGWLGDVRGPRRVLTRIVLWWSGFTMLTGAARGFASLVAIRFLFGAGEAGAFPNVARSFSNWFPLSERGRANGVMFLGSRLGGMLSAPLALWLILRFGWRTAFVVFGAGEAGAFPNLARSLSQWFPQRERGRANGVMLVGSRFGGMISVPLALLVISWWGWRASFVVFGVVGVVWAAAWQAWYRDRPQDHPSITPAEVAWIQQDGPAVSGHAPTPWRAILGSRNLYAICAMYFAFGYGLYFYFTWLPTYLIRELGFSMLAGGLFAALPFLLAGIADVGGGWLTDRLSRRYSLRAGRCYLGTFGFGTCALLVFASTLAEAPVAKALLLAFALASADLALSAAWAVPLDVAPDHAGVMTGFMNTLGNLGGFFGPIVVGYALDRWQSWAIPFHLTAAIYACGAVAWLFIDPSKPIVAARRSSGAIVGGAGEAVT